MALPETGSVKRGVFSPTVIKPLAQGRKGGCNCWGFFSYYFRGFTLQCKMLWSYIMLYKYNLMEMFESLSCFQPMKDLCSDKVLGLYFSDGKRRVDYVLTYQIQKSGSTRSRSSKFGGNNFIRRLRRSLSKRSSRAPLQAKEDPEVAAQEHQTDYHEDDQRFKRDEFEENLQKTGLELEKDEGVRRERAGVREIV